MSFKSVQTASNGLQMDPADFVRAYLQVLYEEGVRDGFVPAWRIALRLRVDRGELVTWMFREGIYRLPGLEMSGQTSDVAMVRIVDAGGVSPIREAIAAVVTGAVIVAALAVLVHLLVR